MYVIFSTTDSILSKLIRRFLKKEYSHIAVCGRSEEFSSWLVSEASRGTVHPSDFDIWSVKNKIISIHKYKKQIPKERMNWMAKQFSKKYSFVSLPLICLGFYYGDGDLRHICSELVAKFLDISTRENVTPKDVENYILESSDFEHVSRYDFIKKIKGIT